MIKSFKNLKMVCKLISLFTFMAIFTVVGSLIGIYNYEKFDYIKLMLRQEK